jgi:SAM-dependent methyltransferase
MSQSKSATGGVLRKALSALRPGRRRKEHKYHYDKLKDRFAGKKAPTPWQDILLLADLRPTDHILDMGCAEGHITMEIARHARARHGVEVEAPRVEEGTRIAKERGLANVTFAAGNATDYPLEPDSYDLVFFLGVLGKKNGDGIVGLHELDRLLKAARRQIYVRVGIQKQSMVDRGLSLTAIMKLMDERGFDSICFARQDASFGNIIVGSRRGTDAKLKKVPPMVLVPAETMPDHPCLKGAQIAAYNEFT